MDIYAGKSKMITKMRSINAMHGNYNVLHNSALVTFSKTCQK